MWVVVYPQGLNNPWLLLQQSEDVSFSAPPPQEQYTWFPRPLAQPYQPSRAQSLYTRSHQDVSFSEVPPPPIDQYTWPPRPVAQPYDPRRVQRLLYTSWGEDVSTATAINEPRDGWVPDPLRVPRPLLPTIGLYYFPSYDSGQGNDESSQQFMVFWSYQTQYNDQVVRIWRYNWLNSAQDADAPLFPDVPGSYTPPRGLYQPYNARPELYQWAPSGDLPPEGFNEPRDGYVPHRVQPYVLPPYWLYAWAPGRDLAPPPASGPRQRGPHWDRRLNQVTGRRPGRW